jgi:hypothetical protein
MKGAILLSGPFLFLSSCGNGEESNLRLVVLNFKNKAPSEKNCFGQTIPTTASGYNCYAIMVTYPEQDSRTSCYEVDSGDLVATPNVASGSVSARKFEVVGFYSTGSCTDLRDLSFNETNTISNPVILGGTTTDVYLDITVPITISSRSTPFFL